MAVPFRIRHAEWIAGLVVLATLAAMIVAFVMLGRAHRSFSDRPTYVVTMDQGHGITAGGQVKLLGVVVGNIESIRITKENKVRAKIELEPQFGRHVTLGTSARIEASFGLETMLGGMALVLVPPPVGAELLASGSEIPLVAPTDVMDLLPVAGHPKALDDLASLVHNLRVLSGDLAAPDSELRRAMTDTAAILAEIRGGKSSVARMLSDDGALYDRVVATLERAEATMAEVGGVVDRAGRIMSKIDGIADKGGDVMDEASAAMGGSKKLVDGAGELVTDMGPVLDDAGKAMKDLDVAVEEFAKVTAQLGALLVKMDKVVVDMAAVTKATKKVWPIKRHLEK